MTRHIFRAILALAACARIAAQPLAGAEPRAETPLALAAALSEPEKMLGLRLAESWSAFGPPEKVFSLRGQEAWQDDVVFQYPNGLSLFWYQDRLWQLRFTGAYAGHVFGLLLGDPVEKLASLLGQPLVTYADSYVFELPYQGYPVRLRAALRAGKIADIYLYRADF